MAGATTAATDVEQVIDQYIVTWNETDPAKRRDVIVRTWTADGSYLDPLMSGEGHDGIDAMIGSVQTQFPGYRFRRTGEVDAHNDRVRFRTQFARDTTDSRTVLDADFGPTSTGFGMSRFQAIASTPREPLIHPRSVG